MKIGEMGAVRPQASERQSSQSPWTRGGHPAPSPEGVSCQVPRAPGPGAGTPHLLRKESAAAAAVLASVFRTVRKPVCCFNPHLWSFVRAALGHWHRRVPGRVLEVCLSVGPFWAPKLQPRQRRCRPLGRTQGKADPPWKCAGRRNRSLRTLCLRAARFVCSGSCT